ncbi:Crinkler (CRN) family protein, partial [Phytophthora palmivora]
MKLFCKVIGADSDAFSVSMEAPDDTTDDLKDAIRAKKSNDLANIDADKLELFPASLNDEWIDADKVET